LCEGQGRLEAGPGPTVVAPAARLAFGRFWSEFRVWKGLTLTKGVLLPKLAPFPSQHAAALAFKPVGINGEMSMVPNRRHLRSPKSRRFGVFADLAAGDMTVGSGPSWQNAARGVFRCVSGFLGGAAPPEITGAHSLFRPAQLFSVCEDDPGRPARVAPKRAESILCLIEGTRRSVAPLGSSIPPYPSLDQVAVSE
jgi:hypothetical protein